MIILFNLYHTDHSRQGHHSCPPAFVRLAKLLMLLAHRERYTGVRSGMSSGDINQKQDLWGRQLSELPSMDDDQHLCRTEGQGRELPHEESTPLVDEEISDHLTEEQYDNILEMLKKVRLLLEETTANYARVETGASIQGLYRMLNSTNKTNEQPEQLEQQLAERQPEQLEQQLQGSP